MPIKHSRFALAVKELSLVINPIERASIVCLLSNHRYMEIDVVFIWLWSAVAHCTGSFPLDTSHSHTHTHARYFPCLFEAKVASRYVEQRKRYSCRIFAGSVVATSLQRGQHPEVGLCLGPGICTPPFVPQRGACNGIVWMLHPFSNCINRQIDTRRDTWGPSWRTTKFSLYCRLIKEVKCWRLANRIGQIRPTYHLKSGN